MSFRKKKEGSIISADLEEKDVKIYYIYKTVMEDELDEELLYKKAYSYIAENEEYDVVCFRDNMWFGISELCKTCVYIDFDDDQNLDFTSIYKFLDKRRWKLKSAFSFLENNYSKIILTSTRPPNSFFQDNRKWQAIVKTFTVVSLD